MFVIISILLTSIGTIGIILGFYKIFVKKEDVVGNHILAYSFFALAISDAVNKSYIVMIINELLAIRYFRDYIHKKEAK